MTDDTQPKANKTDAGNGSKAICRVFKVHPSPSPDPRRSAENPDPMHKSSTITLMFCVGTVLMAPAYWFIAALMSWGGPGDDINIIYILFLPILFHGMIIEKYGFKRTAVNSLVYLLLIAILCIARHIELSAGPGYSERQAGRSLESLAWTLPWFSIGVVASIFSKPEAKNGEAEQGVHGNTH